MLLKAVAESLQQVQELIELSVNHFDQRSDNAQASIGKHVRHIVDHFWALQEGVTTGTVDYNLRHRDSAMESSSDIALEIIDNIQQWLLSLPGENLNLKVHTEISVSHEESMVVESNLYRELIYLLNHTLHHIAYGCLVAKSLSIQVPDYLGVAPATASYQRSVES